MLITVCDVPTEKVSQLPKAAKILIMRSYNGLSDINFRAEFAFRGRNPVFSHNNDVWHFESRGKFELEFKAD